MAEQVVEAAGQGAFEPAGGFRDDAGRRLADQVTGQLVEPFALVRQAQALRLS
ncbi:hypothetical protein HBA54_13375 [Pelagibius litoralis]|uniref:Uncharacterized protein n=1 Tax=Pelagibius litoralis TaxID=374515 RepID=A0A967KFG8_9PROT|nr:hypothetical protein [Pelagibius litoralis]NIA69586.1 hypothetical protein [Pelagibius litoralis]